MRPPAPRTLIVATVAGLAHLGVVEFLFRRLDHVPDVLWPLASIGSAGSVFAFGFLVALLSVHTRLLSPVVGLPVLLAWAAYRDVASPAPEWSELGGHLVVDGAVYLTSYVGTWYVWIATLVALAAVEYGLRGHYEIGDERLRNPPPMSAIPPNRRSTALAAGAVGGTFGVAITAWIGGIGVSPPLILPVLAATTALAAAVPVGAAVDRGLVAPAACFLALVVPVLLNQGFVGGEGGPVFLLLLGPLAVVFAIVGVLENALRSRLSGRSDGATEADG